MKSNEDRALEIKESREKLAQLKANAPDGIDPVELRRQIKHISGKMGEHQRAITCTPDELRDRIIEYFDARQVIETDGDGNVMGVKQTAPITLTGLCNHLGISRHSLYRYAENDDEIGQLLRFARNKIEEIYEGILVYSPKTPVGTIFALKNMGWSDTQQVQITDGSNRRMTQEEIEEAIDADIVM